MSEAFGRYELLKRVGGGGAGEVFLAREREVASDRLFVVKTLLPERADSRDFISMFLDEARLASQLDHPNVCRVFDLGQVDGTLFMALEFVHGVDLEQLSRALERTGRKLPVHLAARIVLDAARGLQHAHQLAGADGKRLGLIHRDISPQNLLVSFHGDVKIIDFGFAKADGRLTQTQSGIIKGKFAYMSPEQVRAEKLDQRSDLFALGAVFFELLTGQRLFRRTTDMETIAAIVGTDAPRPSSVQPQVPAALDSVVLRLLARDRNGRYPDAQTLVEVLEAWLQVDGEPAAREDLARFVRELFREQLERERTLGLLHDAPVGKVSRMGAPSVPWEDVSDVSEISEDSERTQITVRSERTHVAQRPEDHSVTAVAAHRPYTSVVRSLQVTQKLLVEGAEPEEGGMARALKRAMAWTKWARN